MPNPSFPLSRDAQAGVIEVRYSDVDGAERGPFAIRFSPETALLGEQKHILQGMPDSWVQFRDFDAKTLVYFTTLVTYRCAISEVRYGFNDGKPLERYDLPACDTRRPFEVPANAKIYMKVPDTTKAINLRITWVDGTESDVVHVTR